MKFNRRIFLPLTVALLPCFAWAQTVVPDSDEEDEIVADDDADDFDRAVRENPVIIPDEADDIDIPIPAFIKKGANHIIYNGADWSKLRSAFENSKNSPVSIVHIGDSHVQADINTGTTRELLQYDFGNAGRGLISPLSLSVNVNVSADGV